MKMELATSFKSSLLHLNSMFSPVSPLQPLLTKNLTCFRSRRLIIRASSAEIPDAPEPVSWPRLVSSIRRGSDRALSNLCDSLRRSNGFDFGDARVRLSGFIDGFKDGVKKEQAAIDRFRLELLPAFVEWNRLGCWKELKTWEYK